MLGMEQLKVKIKDCTIKIKALSSNHKVKQKFEKELECHQNVQMAKENITSLFLDVEHIIQDIYSYFISMTSIDDVMKNLPETGQLLSELSHIPIMQMCPQLFTAWLKCVLWFYKRDALSPIEVKARDWALKLLHSTVSYQMKAGDPALRNLAMMPSVLLKKQLSHNIYKITQLLETRNGRHWDSSTGSYRLSTCEQVSVLKDLSNVLLTMHHENEFCSLWLTVLQQLSQCPLDEDILNIYLRLTVSQKGAYSGECKVNLPYNSLVLLWSSHLPALEQEVLEMVHAVSLFLGLPFIVKKIIKSRNLAVACSENYQVAHAVHQMLYSLLVKTGGAGLMSDTVTQFYECVREGGEQNNIKDVCLPHSSLYRPELQPLVSLLSYPTNNLGAETVNHRLKQISDVISLVLKSTSGSPQMMSSLAMLALEFKHWIYRAMWHVILCDKKNVDSCLDVIYLSEFYNTDVEGLKSSIREMVHCLRGLVGKTNLKLPDIEYTVSSSIKPDRDNSTARQILVVFLLQSVSGLHLAGEILRLATCNTSSRDHLYVLLYAHQIFNIDMTTWSPYKASRYTQLLKTLREKLSYESEEQEESGIKSVQNHKNILIELETLLCMPALCR
ncbi:Fanconi anemia group C protein homolog [Gigantopelta aegis]|uniref:Fanconi anemia group C protein homolog n=1 Tax=Gigantopelta aegis TaxID=1735272 RepID=UPI001B889619|nr:Fanconi anemia group C protein homolog [Gigantopelta aegis]